MEVRGARRTSRRKVTDELLEKVAQIYRSNINTPHTGSCSTFRKGASYRRPVREPSAGGRLPRAGASWEGGGGPVRGSIVKRGASYSVVIDLDRDPSTGRRRQKWHSGYHTKREAAAALAELVSSVNRGSHVPKTRQTLAQYIQEWLTAIAPTVKPSTHYSYSRNLRLHVVAYFGSTPLSAVDPGMLNGLYAHLLVEGRKDQVARGLSPRPTS